MKSYQPDPKFRVRVATIGDVIVFLPPGPLPQDADWEKVEGTHVVLAGDVTEALTGLIDNYTNKQWAEMLAFHPSVLRKLRRHLGIAAPSGGRGGARPRTGRKKGAPESTAP